VDTVPGSIDVADGQAQRLAEAKAHRVGGDPEGAQTRLTGVGNDGGELLNGEDVGQGVDPGRLDHIKPGHVASEDVLVEESDPVAIDLHGAPAVRVDELIEKGVELLDAELVGTTIGEGGETAHAAGVGLDGLVGVAVPLQGAKQLLV
jgi:hypothetical protein